MEAELARDRDRQAPGEAPAADSAIDGGGPPRRAPEAENAAPKLISSRSRCPYCHEEVRTERADWVACEGCLARHHTSCWNERGSCASCHGQGVLARRRSRRVRGVLGMAALGVLAAGGGFLSARKLDSRRVDPAEPHVVAGTARDEALLGLAFLSQSAERERFMDRMVAAASRYDALGKAADAKLLRDVASVALAQGYSEGLRFLDESSRKTRPDESDDATRKNKETVARLKIDERKLAYSIFAIRPTNGEDAVRQRVSVKFTDMAQKLLDIAQGYREAQSYEDAKVTQEAADALVRGDREVALKLLGLPTAPEVEAPAAPKEARIEVRELIDSAQLNITGVHNGTHHPSYRFAAAKSLLAASVIAQKLGSGAAAAALQQASERASDEKFDYEGAQKALDAAKLLVGQALDDSKPAESEKR